MRKKISRLATVVVLAGALVGAGASSAFASGWRLAGIYGWPDQCLSIGYHGTQTGSWALYYCETVTPGNMGTGGPGTYKLWVQ